MSLPVYVAGPWTLGPWIRSEVYERLGFIGACPVSSWTNAADGSAEDLYAISDEDKLAACNANDRDLHRAAVVLLVTAHGVGSASFGEARYALALRKPVVWVGPRFNVDAWRPGVTRVTDLDEAMVVLAGMAQRAVQVSA
jgi:hypothetical protein